MNYYDEIKQELINNEVYKQVKDYSKNKSDLNTYYNVGKLLVEAGKHYGEGIIKEYSIKLTKEIGRGYSWRNLYNMILYYKFLTNNLNLQLLAANLTWTHYTIILPLKDNNKIRYYINQIIIYNLSKRELIEKIKNKEYERLDDNTKNKLILNEKQEINDFIKDPIIIKNNSNKEIISEKVLHNLILEDITSFMEELGDGFSFIKSEYKIKIGDRYNYIVIELKKEHIGQITTYMNYINCNIKRVEQNSTIGIILILWSIVVIQEYLKQLMKYYKSAIIIFKNFIFTFT